MSQHPIEQRLQLSTAIGKAFGFCEILETEHCSTETGSLFWLAIVLLQLPYGLVESSHKLLLMGGEQSNTFGIVSTQFRQPGLPVAAGRL